MKLTKTLTAAAIATTMFGGLAASTSANAEVSANMSVANFYLWRGLDISAGAPQISGGFDYGHESGAYAGIWTTSEAVGTETDLYIGFAGEAGDIGYDISFWEYLYPSDNSIVAPKGKFSDSDLSELAVGVSFMDAGLSMTFGNDTGGGDDYTYTTLDYTYGDYNVLYGFWSFDKTVGGDDAHLTVSYAATDNFTFTVTKGIPDANAGVYDTDFLFHVAYSLPVDFK